MLSVSRRQRAILRRVLSTGRRNRNSELTLFSRFSKFQLLDAFRKFGYSNLIGPGLYDIHSPRVPSVEEMKKRLADFMKALPHQKQSVSFLFFHSRLFKLTPSSLSLFSLFINPDCGLKTRGWPEVEASLTNLVEVAKWARSEYPQ